MSKGTVNKVMLVGRLGKDPDLRYTASGTAAVNFSMATNHSVRDPEGNYADKTEWHRVVAFGRIAEVAGEYLTKGKLVFIEGRAQNRSWEDQKGQKRYVNEVVCSNMQLLGSRNGSNGKSEETAPEEPENSETVPPEDQQAEGDDLPF